MKILKIMVLLSIVFLCPVRAHASDSVPSDINQKLDKVLENQSQILSELSDVKKELEIVKVRATLAS